jgi:hypothetical protein
MFIIVYIVFDVACCFKSDCFLFFHCAHCLGHSFMVIELIVICFHHCLHCPGRCCIGLNLIIFFILHCVHCLGHSFIIIELTVICVLHSLHCPGRSIVYPQTLFIVRFSVVSLSVYLLLPFQVEKVVLIRCHQRPQHRRNHVDESKCLDREMRSKKRST